MFAALKFLASAIDFCSTSSFGIFVLAALRFYSRLLAYAAAFDFLNSSYFILFLFSLCLDSNSFNSLVLWMKLSTLTFRSSNLSSKLSYFYSIYRLMKVKLLAYFYNSWDFLLIASDSDTLACSNDFTCSESSLLSFYSESSFFFRYWSLIPSSLNVSSTALIYFFIEVTLVVASFRLYLFSFNFF